MRSGVRCPLPKAGPSRSPLSSAEPSASAPTRHVTVVCLWVWASLPSLLGTLLHGQPLPNALSEQSGALTVRGGLR